MNALVTGAGGFLGRYIVEQLVARGDTVRALGRSGQPSLDIPGVEPVQVDLTDRKATVAACRDVDVVFHVAGVAGIWGPWSHYYRNNILATRHVLEGCVIHGVRRLIYTSSPSVVFDGKDLKGVDESAPYSRRWLCHYPRSKALAEHEVLAANGEGRLLTCALRPHLIWGPRDRHLIPRLIAQAMAGQLCRVGDGTNLIDTTYVENAAEAHLQAADALNPGSAAVGHAYFLSQGEPVNCWQWIDELLSLAGLPRVGKSTSLRFAWTLGGILEAVYRLLRIPGEPPMTRFLACQLGKSHHFDIRRAMHDFGYRPRVSTAEGMRRLAAAGLPSFAGTIPG